MMKCDDEVCIKYSTNSICYCRFILLHSTIAYCVRQWGHSSQQADTRPNLVGDPVKQRFDALMGKAQGTGQRIAWVGEQVTTNPVLGREGLDFLLARSLVTA